MRKETLVHILPGSLIRHKAEGSQCTAHSTVIDALMSPRLFPGLYPCVRVRRIICLDGLYPQAAAGQPVGHRAEIGRTAVLPGRSNSVTRKFFCTLHQQRTHGIIDGGVVNMRHRGNLYLCLGSHALPEAQAREVCF